METQNNAANFVEDDFFQDIANTKPYLKVAFEGFAGAGKTFSAALFTIGLYKRIGSTKPIVIFDTETSAKFLIPLFRDAGIRAVVKPSRSLKDLKETMARCKAGYSDILFIDSLSHVWEDFCEAYKRQKNRTRLEMLDWGVVKPTFKREFSDPFVLDPYHCIFTGRAGYEYSQETNEETGKREIFKSGVKMKVEGDTAYEPDMIVLMERLQEMENNNIKRVIRRATIIKDRSNLIDGKAFEFGSDDKIDVADNVVYKVFSPVVEVLLANPVKPMAAAETDAADLVKSEDGRREWIRRKDIALETIENYLVKVWPGATADNKRNKLEAVEYAFGTLSWEEVKTFSPDRLEEGYVKVIEFVQKKIAEVKAETEPKEESPAAKAMKKGEAEAKKKVAA